MERWSVFTDDHPIPRPEVLEALAIHCALERQEAQDFRTFLDVQKQLREESHRHGNISDMEP